MKNKFLTRLIAVSAGLLLLGSSARAATNYVANFLTGTNDWTANNVYVLTNFTYVLSNAVLNIEPGTLIQGVKTNAGGGANSFGCLFVCRGGKIFAEGTPQRPIVFTSTSDDGFLPFPTRGEWGGIVLFGQATLNNPAFTTNTLPVNYDIYEGLPDDTNALTGEYLHRFGGPNDDDSSGVLRYVSIRHGGKILSTDKEVNGLSLGAVGRGTVIDHVEAYCIADDGFEFFGGSVNTKYLISAFNDDDAFDTDEGYHGKNQFWFGIQEPGKRDEGSEQNGQPNPTDVPVPGALPLANYEVYNATLIGGGTTGSGNDSMNIRVQNFCKWYNSVYTEFQGDRCNIDGTSQPDIRYNIFFGHAGGNGTGYGTVYCPAAVNPIIDPQIRNTDRGQNNLLDPRPLAGSPVFTGYTNAPGNGYYNVANYKGAFNGVNWAYDWSALTAEAHMSFHGGGIECLPLAATALVIPQPTLTIVPNGGNVDMQWDTVLGASYQLQSRSPITGGWGDVGLPIPGTGGTVTSSQPVGIADKYFRVVAQ